MNRDNVDKVKVWTDGSCASTNRIGGWAFYAEYGTRRAQRYGFALDTTINVMELTAIRRALEFIRITEYPLVLYTDSQYARKSLIEWAEQWQRRDWTTRYGADVKNKELIQDTFKLLENHRAARSVLIKWIAGHSGHLNNNRCDRIANEARVNKHTNWRASVETHLTVA